MGYGAESTINKFILFIMFLAVAGSLIGTAVTWINNVSASGIAFAAVLGAILPLLVGFFILKGGMHFFGGK